MAWDLVEFLFMGFRNKRVLVPTLLICLVVSLFLFFSYYKPHQSSKYPIEMKTEAPQAPTYQVYRPKDVSIKKIDIRPMVIDQENKHQEEQPIRKTEALGFNEFERNFKLIMVKENYNPAIVTQIVDRIEDDMRQDHVGLSYLQAAIAEALPEASDEELEHVKDLLIKSVPMGAKE